MPNETYVVTEVKPVTEVNATNTPEVQQSSKLKKEILKKIEAYLKTRGVNVSDQPIGTNGVQLLETTLQTVLFDTPDSVDGDNIVMDIKEYLVKQGMPAEMVLSLSRSTVLAVLKDTLAAKVVT